MFLGILDEVRLGDINESNELVLKRQLGAKVQKNGIEPVEMYALKKDVRDANERKLAELKSEKITSTATYTGNKFDIEILKREGMAEHTLTYCRGAQVMMLTNERGGKWVNGSMGIIEETSPLRVKLADGNVVSVLKNVWERRVPKTIDGRIQSVVVAEMTAYPIKIAYATTIHKSQGLTLDMMKIDLSNSFACGQCYVGLSRVRSLSGLSLIAFNKRSIKADPRVLKFYGYE